jgi:hypothetical protein
VVGQSEEKMLLLGRMDIAQLLSEREVEAHYRELVYEARYHVIADVCTAKRFDRVVPEQVARSITSERGARIAFASGTEYRLLSSSLQPRLWLTEDSARALDRLLDSEAGPSGDRLELIADLENRKQARGRGRTARQNRAVELQGMRLATHEYERDGWKVEDVSATCSYDLLCTKRGEPDLYVEVKGSAEAQIAGVVLTRNEVALARRHPEPSTRNWRGAHALRGVSARGQAADSARLRISTAAAGRAERPRPPESSSRRSVDLIGGSRRPEVPTLLWRNLQSTDPDR